MVDSFYQDQCILLTGCTRFLGKVILEKILFSLPQVKRIYTFIRSKSGSSIRERFQKEIIDSPCFNRLRGIGLDFDSMIREKVIPMRGDLLKDNLDLSSQDEQELISNINIIIHSAASVDFNQRLDQALQINTLGSLRILKLAKLCKNLKSVVHISTAYVNCDKSE